MRALEVTTAVLGAFGEVGARSATYAGLGVWFLLVVLFVLGDSARRRR